MQFFIISHFFFINVCLDIKMGLCFLEEKCYRISNSIFLVEFSGNIGRNGFLTSIASQKIFRPYFQKSRLEYYFLCLFYFSSPFSGHFRSNFLVFLLFLTARSRRTRKLAHPRNVQNSRTRKVKET